MKFDATVQEIALVGKIIDRAEALGFDQSRPRTVMDLIACHANGCPLDLAALADAPDSDLMHDVAGIARHIDRTTGALGDCFWPRFALPDERTVIT